MSLIDKYKPEKQGGTLSKYMPTKTGVLDKYKPDEGIDYPKKVEVPEAPDVIDESALNIKETDPFLTKAKKRFIRYQSIPAKALLGDVPFVRKAIPKDVREFTPEGLLEKSAFTTYRLGRDFGITSKIVPLKGLKLIAGAAAFGAGTAGSEKPMEIAKEAGKEAIMFKGIDLFFKRALPFLGKAASAGFKRLPQPVRDKMLRAGQAIGLSIKKYAGLEKLKFMRRSQIKIAQIEGEKFAKTLEQNLTDDQLKAMTFMIEGKIPRTLKNKNIISILKDRNQRAILRGYSDALRNQYDDLHRELIEVYGKDVGYVKNYINRLWNIPKNREKEVVNWFMTNTGHIKKRGIKSLAEGMDKFGLTPKELSATNLYRIYNNNVMTAAANTRYVHGLKNLKSPEGSSLVMRIDKAPPNYVSIPQISNHPVLKRGMYMGKAGEAAVIKDVPVKFHPDIADEMKTIFGSKAGGNAMRAFEAINAYAKYSQLSLSLFHHVALTESAIATGVFNPSLIPKVIKAMKKGEKPILTDPSVKFWIKGGLDIGAPTDIHRNLVESSLRAAEDNIRRIAGGKIAAQPVKVLRSLLGANNKFLWDYYHPTLKLAAANKLYHSALKSPKFANLPKEAVQREVAQFVNDTFGGQSWDLMTKSPQWQQMMHAVLLSPDWFLSTTRQALSVFGAGSRNSVTKALRQELGTEFWRAGAMMFYANLNALNRTFTKFHLGEERDMWDNDIGRQTHLFLGFNPDGSKKYLRWGKQFRELPEFFIKNSRLDPIGAIIGKSKSKSSPFLQFIEKQRFPHPYSQLGKAAGTKKELPMRAATVLESFVPFSVQAITRQQEFTPLSFAFPISKGTTYYRSLELFKEAVRANDVEMAKKVFKDTAENNINPTKILKRAVSEVRYEESGGYKKANEIYTYLKRKNIPYNQWEAYLNKMGVNEKVRKMIGKILKDKKEAGLVRESLKAGVEPPVEKFFEVKK